MLSAFVLDLFVFIYLEITSFIIETAMAVSRPVLLFHAACAFGLLVCYFLMIYLGTRLLAGEYSQLINHRKLAYVFCTLRIATYISSYFIWI